MVTWASAKYSKQPVWPPARLRDDKRLRPFYLLVLYLPALLWLPVLAVGLVSMTGCGILHLWRWLVRKLSFGLGRDGSGDEASLSKQTEGIGRVAVSPVGGASADATNPNVVQVEQRNRSIGMAEKSAPRLTSGHHEHAVHRHQLLAANKITRQAAGEGEEKSWERKGLEKGCG